MRAERGGNGSDVVECGGICSFMQGNPQRQSRAGEKPGCVCVCVCAEIGMKYSDTTKLSVQNEVRFLCTYQKKRQCSHLLIA